MDQTSTRTAIVTGGARGIGAAISERLAADGMKVAVIDLREEDTADVVGRIRAAGGEALGIGANIADEEQAAVPRSNAWRASWAHPPCSSTTRASSGTTCSSR